MDFVATTGVVYGDAGFVVHDLEEIGKEDLVCRRKGAAKVELPLEILDIVDKPNSDTPQILRQSSCDDDVALIEVMETGKLQVAK